MKGKAERNGIPGVSGGIFYNEYSKAGAVEELDDLLPPVFSIGTPNFKSRLKENGFGKKIREDIARRA